MHTFLHLLAAMLAAPFWESKPAREWSYEELRRIMEDSPWAQTTDFQNKALLPIYLATAKPLREAEAESIRRHQTASAASQTPPPDTARSEYEAFLADNEGAVIVVAIPHPNPLALASREETERMEEESYLRTGRQKIKMKGHFPPAPTDPVLRLIFPRPAGEIKDLRFELYVPGVTGPYRQVTFRTKDLHFKGRLEM